MSDLEHVDRRQPAGQQHGIDIVLSVACEQEAAVLIIAEQDDRGVVGLSVVRRVGIEIGRPHGAVVGPEHMQSDVVQSKRVSRSKTLGP